MNESANVMFICYYNCNKLSIELKSLIALSFSRSIITDRQYNKTYLLNASSNNISINIIASKQHIFTYL